jgi:AraC family transcriptional regulator
MEYLQKIQRAVDFIEAHLDDELTVDAIARAACLSRWHFQVIFHAMVGDTLAEYIRKRRLTAAALALTSSQERIIEIALAAGFGSQAAFARAFKAQFRVTPGECRKQGFSNVFMLHKPKITRSYLNHLYTNITMKPVIKKFPKTKVIGLSARFIAGISPETNNLQVIPPLWKTFMARGHEIAERSSSASYGVIVCLKESDKKSHPDEMLYLAGVPVKASAKPPRGMTELTIPAGDYAVFTHRGAVEDIRHTLNYIYGSWLPKSGRTLRDVPHIEVYDECFKHGQKDSEFDVGIPVA